MLFGSRWFGNGLSRVVALGLFVTACGDDASSTSTEDAGNSDLTESEAGASETTPTTQPTESSSDDGTSTSSESDAAVNPTPVEAGTSEVPTSAGDAGSDETSTSTSMPGNDAGNDAGTSTTTEPPTSSGDAGADSDAGAGDEYSGVEEVPLLERASTAAYACEVSTAAKLLHVPSGFDASLTLASDVAWYARGESPDVGDYSLELSALAPDGSIATTTSLGSSPSETFSRAQVVATPSQLWVFSERYGSSASLTLAKASLAGERIQFAKPIDGTDDVGVYNVAVGTDGVAILFSRNGGDAPGLYFATLDFDGNLVGDAQLVESGVDSVAPGAITATSDGYLFSYVIGYMPAALYVRSVDQAGTVGERVPFADSPNDLDYKQALLNRGDEILFAWTDTGGTWDNSDLNRTTILSRLSLEGTRLAQDVRVQTPVTNQERVEPQLIPRGDDIGLLWSEGSVIYFCAGCMPDNQLDFVMLDGATLSPASDVVTLTNPAEQGGLITPAGVWQGDSLTVVAAVGYHVNGEGAAGALECLDQ